MDSRVQIIRLWLLVIVGLVASCAGIEFCICVGMAGLGLFPSCGDCCGSTCGNCTTAAHSQYQVVITGIGASGDALGQSCNLHDTNCSQYNATYTLSSNGTCQYLAMISPCMCNDARNAAHKQNGVLAVNRIEAAFAVSGSDTLVTVQFQNNGGGTTDCTVVSSQSNEGFLWQKTFAGGADCGGFSSTSIDYNSAGAIGCSSSGAAALITAL